MGKIVHIVLWKLKPQSSPAALQSVKEGIEALRQVAGPETMHISAPLIDARAKGYDYGLYSVFESRQALETYAVSDAHVKVVEEKIKPNVQDVLAYDWELPA